MTLEHESVESWARSYVLGSGAPAKIHPPPPPDVFTNHGNESTLQPGRKNFEVVLLAEKLWDWWLNARILCRNDSAFLGSMRLRCAPNSTCLRAARRKHGSLLGA